MHYTLLTEELLPLVTDRVMGLGCSRRLKDAPGKPGPG